MEFIGYITITVGRWWWRKEIRASLYRADETFDRPGYFAWIPDHPGPDHGHHFVGRLTESERA